MTEGGGEVGIIGGSEVGIGAVGEVKHALIYIQQTKRFC